MATEFYSNYKAGSKRFTELLLLPEYEDVAKPSDEIGLVELENVSASWYKKDVEAESENANGPDRTNGKPITNAGAEQVEVEMAEGQPLENSKSEATQPDKESSFFTLSNVSILF
jgi:hypothetical protein